MQPNTLVLALVSVFTLASAAQAQQFPTKPITVVIPGTAGSSPDIQARLYGAEMGKTLGQPVITDIRPGAGGGIGTTYAARAVPDGHTLLSVATTFAVLPAFSPLDKVPYDPVKDFAPLSMMVRNSSMLLVRPDAPFKTFPEYLAYARANPGKINFGTTGSGGIYHIVGAFLHSQARAPVTFVHYKGSGQMFTDMIAGRVDAAPAITFIGLPFVKSGKLRAIANLGKDGSGSALPDLKTAAEMGVPGFDYPSWSGWLAPGKTPPAVVKRLSGELQRIARIPEIAKKFEAEYSTMVGSTSEEFARTIAVEYARWRKVVEENNIKLEQ